MTPEGHNDLFPLIESILREADAPMDCHQVYDKPGVRDAAPSVNRVSDYLGVLFRRGTVKRVANINGTPGTRARWAYIWKDKELPAWKKQADQEPQEYRPKAVLDRPSIYITEEGNNVFIQMPNLSITIKRS